MSRNEVAGEAPSVTDILTTLGTLLPRIGEHAAERERNRDLPFDSVALLREHRVTSLRIPERFGGPGGSLRELFAAIVDIATEDSNVAQGLRAHFSFVETLRADCTEEVQRHWYPRLVEGVLMGNATTERGTATPVEFRTTLLPDGSGGWILDGAKHYSTGTLFASHLAVLAVSSSDELVTAVVPVDREGVHAVDDWSGMGQRTTASGTTTFDQVRVADSEVLRTHAEPNGPIGYLGGFRQLYLAAVSAGVAEAAAQDAVRFARTRARPGPHSVTESATTDPYVLETVGDISAQAFAARSVVLTAAESLDTAAQSGEVDDILTASIDVARAQVTANRSALAAAQHLFDTGGASALDEGLNLHRHWRNARTLASHNPVAYKKRAIGDHLLNNAEPPRNGYF